MVSLSLVRRSSACGGLQYQDPARNELLQLDGRSGSWEADRSGRNRQAGGIAGFPCRDGGSGLLTRPLLTSRLVLVRTGTPFGVGARRYLRQGFCRCRMIVP